MIHGHTVIRGPGLRSPARLSAHIPWSNAIDLPLMLLLVIVCAQTPPSARLARHRNPLLTAQFSHHRGGEARMLLIRKL
jgi:hypothetical protein